MRHLLLAGAALCALSAAGCATPQASSTLKSPTSTSSSPSVAATPSASTSAPASPTTPPAPVVVGTRDNPLPYGGTSVGQTWSVSVDAVNAETANADMQAENPYNESAFGQFVLVRISAANISTEVANPSDLARVFAFVGADNRLYEPAFGVTPDALDDQPSALNGGKVSGNILFDVTPEAVGAGVIAAPKGEDDLTFWSSAVQ